MKLLFKQRLFSWFDSYDIYNEAEETIFTVKGKLSWGHCLKIYDAAGSEIGTVKEVVLTLLPKFELYLGDTYVGCISKELSFLKPKYNIDCNGWHMVGDFMRWNYSILDMSGRNIAVVSKQVFHLTDTYVIDVCDPQDALFLRADACIGDRCGKMFEKLKSRLSFLAFRKFYKMWVNFPPYINLKLKKLPRKIVLVLQIITMKPI